MEFKGQRQSVSRANYEIPIKTWGGGKRRKQFPRLKPCDELSCHTSFASHLPNWELLKKRKETSGFSPLALSLFAQETEIASHKSVWQLKVVLLKLLVNIKRRHTTRFVRAYEETLFTWCLAKGNQLHTLVRRVSQRGHLTLATLFRLPSAKKRKKEKWLWESVFT